MRKVKLPGSFHTKSELLARMNSYGINSALTYHAFAQELNSLDGNAMLLSEIAGEPRLFPLWSVMPHHTGEFPEPDKLICEMKKNQVKAVTMFSALEDYYFSINEWSVGELLSALETHGIPLFLRMNNFSNNINGLFEMLSAHPKLIVCLKSVTYRMARILFPLLEMFENLYIESSGYKQQDGIEDFCKRFGAERMLFGSGMPTGSGSAAVAMITYSNITLDEKKLIASENLNRILGGVSL